MGAALEEFVLFESLFFSKCDIRMLLFMCRLRNSQSQSNRIRAVSLKIVNLFEFQKLQKVLLALVCEC